MPGLDPLQQPHPEETSDHGSAPVERNKTCCGFGGEARNLGRTEIIYQKTSDGHFGAHIGENPQRAKEEIRMFPDGIVNFPSRARGGAFDWWQPGGLYR